MLRRLRRGRQPDLFMLEGSKQQQVKGESQYQDALSRICGGKTRDGHNVDVIAVLQPEPENRFDGNAVAVLVDGRQVGYLAKEQAAQLQRSIISLANSNGQAIGCRAQIVGGWDRGRNDQGHFGVRLFFDPNRISS